VIAERGVCGSESGLFHCLANLQKGETHSGHSASLRSFIEGVCSVSHSPSLPDESLAENGCSRGGCCRRLASIYLAGQAGAMSDRAASSCAELR